MNRFCGLAALVVSLVALGFSLATFFRSSLTLRQLRIVNAKGEQRIILFATNGGPGEEAGISIGEPPWMGGKSLGMHWSSWGLANFHVSENGKNTSVLGADWMPVGPALAGADKVEPRQAVRGAHVWTTPSSSLTLRDPSNGDIRLTLGTDWPASHKTGLNIGPWSGIYVLDENGNVTAQMPRTTDDVAYIVSVIAEAQKSPLWKESPVKAARQAMADMAMEQFKRNHPEMFKAK